MLGAIFPGPSLDHDFAERWHTLLMRQSGPEILEDADGSLKSLGTVGSIETLGSKTTSVLPRS